MTWSKFLKKRRSSSESIRGRLNKSKRICRRSLKHLILSTLLIWLWTFTKASHWKPLSCLARTSRGLNAWRGRPTKKVSRRLPLKLSLTKVKVIKFGEFCILICWCCYYLSLFRQRPYLIHKFDIYWRVTPWRCFSKIWCSKYKFMIYLILSDSSILVDLSYIFTSFHRFRGIPRYGCLSLGLSLR